MSTFEPPDNAQPARHRIRDEIQKRILRGDFLPGQKLRQIELSQQFAVAQTVIRESLLELQFCGLVRVVDRVGAFVSELAPATLQEAFHIREMHEGLAARLCCEHASRRDLTHLQNLADQILALGQSGEATRMSQLDREFHLHMIHTSDNQMLIRLAEGYRLLGMVVRAQRDIHEVHTEHRRMVETIARGDADEAERLARAHVQAARQEVKRQIESGRFAPQWVVEDADPTPEGSVTDDSATTKP